MAIEDNVKTLEDECKLIKGELKQTLVEVRDFLTDLKLPPGDEALIGLLGGGGGGGGPNSQTPPVVEQPRVKPVERPAAEVPPPPQSTPQYNPPPQAGQPPFVAAVPQAPQPLIADDEDLLDSLDSDSSEAGDFGDEDNSQLSDEEDTLEDGKVAEENNKAADEASQEENMDKKQIANPQSQVNMLANLIRWVSSAKKLIGASQLPVFLDVYEFAGEISPEIKTAILHLADVATGPDSRPEGQTGHNVLNEETSLCLDINSSSSQLPDDLKDKIRHLTELMLQKHMATDMSSIWSQLVLELHGVLSGGGEIGPSAASGDRRPSYAEPSRSFPDGEDMRQVKADMDHSNSGARLKLVMPVNGREQEVDLGQFGTSDGRTNRPLAAAGRKK